jgi:hypothetical protein
VASEYNLAPLALALIPPFFKIAAALSTFPEMVFSVRSVIRQVRLTTLSEYGHGCTNSRGKRTALTEDRPLRWGIRLGSTPVLAPSHSSRSASSLGAGHRRCSGGRCPRSPVRQELEGIRRAIRRRFGRSQSQRQVYSHVEADAESAKDICGLE